MKNILSRISILFCLMAACLFVPVVESEAAEGTVQITDETAEVGEIAEVLVIVEADGAELGDCQMTFTYDTDKLEFVEGDYSGEIDGGFWLAQYGTGEETEFRFSLQFRVLEEGSSTLELIYSTAYLYSNEVLYLQTTGGTISSEDEVSASGDPVEIDGTTYYFYDDFTEALILDGFATGTLDYAGVTHNVLVQELTGRIAAYFVNGENEVSLKIYDEATGTFIPTELVDVSGDYYMILFSDTDAGSFSDTYAETTIEINGTVFPAWQNMNNTEYFLVYGLSSAGFEGYYQYDNVEGTYQRFIKSDSQYNIEAGKFDNIILDKLNKIVNDNFVYFLAGNLILILLFIIILIIMSSTIGKRTAELEDLYEELEGRDSGYSSAQKRKNTSEIYEDEYEDEYEYEDDTYEDEYENDEYEDDVYEDEYENDEYEDDTYEYENDEYEDDTYEDEYEEEEDLVYYENPRKSVFEKKSFWKKSSKKNIDSDIDYIDL